MARKLKNRTRKLLLETLTKMGIEYEFEAVDDSIQFNLYDKLFCVEAHEEGRYISIEFSRYDIHFYLDDVRFLLNAINEANYEGKNSDSGVTISFDSKEIKFYKSILFIEEIPDLDDYLRMELLKFVRANISLNYKLEKFHEIEVEKKGSKLDGNHSIRDLFIETISEMGCTFEPSEEDNNAIVMDYRHRKFFVIFQEYNHYINISHAYYFHKVKLSNTEEVSRLHEAINTVNQIWSVTTVCEVPKRSRMLKVYSKRDIPFMPEMPNLIGFLHDVLDEFFAAESDLKIELEKLKEQ